MHDSPRTSTANFFLFGFPSSSLRHDIYGRVISLFISGGRSGRRELLDWLGGGRMHIQIFFRLSVRGLCVPCLAYKYQTRARTSGVFYGIPRLLGFCIFFDCPAGDTAYKCASTFCVFMLILLLYSHKLVVSSSRWTLDMIAWLSYACKPPSLLCSLACFVYYRMHIKVDNGRGSSALDNRDRQYSCGARLTVPRFVFFVFVAYCLSMCS